MPHEMAIPEPPPPHSDVCTWTEDYEGNWYAACGEVWTLTEGTPAENHYRFCPGCGKPITEQHKWMA